MNDERLTPDRERVIRDWPRERIKPITVARCLDSVLAELDALRAELSEMRALAGAPAAPSGAVRAAAARLLHETDLHRDTAPAPDDSLLTFEADIETVARFVLEGADGHAAAPICCACSRPRHEPMLGCQHTCLAEP